MVDPGTWSVVPTPAPYTSNNVLNACACVTSSFCQAVGEAVQRQQNQTLVLQSNRTGWSIVASPSTSATLDGGGYWLVASDGDILTKGDAGFFCSQGGTTLNKPVVGMGA